MYDFMDLDRANKTDLLQKVRCVVVLDFESTNIDI